MKIPKLWRIGLLSGLLVMLLLMISIFSAEAGKVKYVRFITSESDPVSVKVNEEIINAFKKDHPDVEIIPEYLTLQDTYTKLLVMVRAGAEPKIAYVNDLQIVPFVKRGLLIPVDDIIDSIGRADFSKPFIDACTIDGKCYAIPAQTCLWFYFYRKDLFAKAGLVPPKTPDEALRSIKKLTQDTNGDGAIDIYGISVQGSPTINLQSRFMGEIRRYGGHLFNPENKLAFSTIYRKEAIAALQYMKKLAECAPPGKLSHGYFESGMNYATGKAASLYYPARLISTMRDNAPQYMDVTGAAFPPVPEGGKKVIIAGQNVWCIFKDPPNTELAKEFLKFYMSGTQYAKFLCTVPLHLIPLRLSFRDNPYMLSNPLVKKFLDVYRLELDSLKYATSFWDYPESPHSEMFMPCWGSMKMAEWISDYYAGKCTVEEAIDGSAEAWNRIGHFGYAK